MIRAGSNIMALFFRACCAFLLIQLSSAQDSITSSTPIAVSSEALSSSLSSLVSESISASIESSRSAVSSTAPIATPVNITDYGFDDAIISVMSAWPPIQTGTIDIPDSHIQAVIDQITANGTDDRNETISSRDAPLKVMIVGDSMTQGAEGDWTWRYRMWQWFVANNINVNFVGPYTGTQAGLPPPQPPQPPPLNNASPGNPLFSGPGLNINGKYAADVDPNFNSAHFAIWGRTCALDATLIQGFVQQYQPDMLLVMLGFNDLGWFLSDENGLINSMQSFITNARKGNANLKFAIANVPMRLWMGRQDLVDKTNNYNKILPGYLTQWSTANSPLAQVELRHVYNCDVASCPAGYDGLHPDSEGDYDIASAFSNTLYNFYKLGRGPLQIPSTFPQRPVSTPGNFQVVSSGYGVTATWDPVYGAYGYEVQVSLNGGPWQSSSSITNRWDTVWPFAGISYGVRVRTNCGMFDYLKSPWTSTIAATARPLLAPPPQNVQSFATATGWTVTFDPPTGPNTDSIIEYNIIWWDRDQECAFIAGTAFSGSPAHLDGLTPGHRFLIAPTTWNKWGMGFPVGAFDVKVGYTETPPQISGMNVVLADNNNVYITWNGLTNAAGYNIFARNTLNSSDFLQSAGTVIQNCWNGFIFFPANSFIQFCVSAFNGNRDSGYSPAQCSIAPSPTSTINPPPQCPTPAPWCPQFFNPAPAPSGDGGAPVYTQTLTYNAGATGGAAGTTASNGSPVAGVTPTTYAGGSTSVIGGTTTVVSGSTIVYGGSTTVVGGTTIVPTPESSSKPWPQCFGNCNGPDCHNGACAGPICACFSCTGTDCHNNVCTGGDCTPNGCLGPGCINGFCQQANCATNGCSGCGSDGKTHGSNDGGSGHCSLLNCISIGCVGVACHGNTNGGQGICGGPDCSIVTCTGPDCVNGGCVGPSCTHIGTIPGGSPDAPKDNPDQDCTLSKTATICSAVVTQQATTTVTSSSCRTVTGCGVSGSSTTSTTSVGSARPAPTNNEYYDSLSGYAVPAALKQQVLADYLYPLETTEFESTQNDMYALNLYADQYCQVFVGALTQDDLVGGCYMLPVPLQSFAILSSTCGANQKTGPAFGSGYSCDGTGVVVSQNCANNQPQSLDICQKFPQPMNSVSGNAPTQKRLRWARDFYSEPMVPE